MVRARSGGTLNHQRICEFNVLTNAAFEFVVTDLAGSPQEIVDPETGSITGLATQTLYGQRTWQGHSFSPLLYAGQYLDAESGWAYNRYRYYHPHAGVYNAQDPLGLAPRLASAQGYVDHAAHWYDYLGLHNPHVAPDDTPIRTDGRNSKGQFTGPNTDSMRGIEEHKRFSAEMKVLGYKVDKALPDSGGAHRPDAHLVDTQRFITEVHELKPDSRTGKIRGNEQLARYKEYTESYNSSRAKKSGLSQPTVKYVLEFYKP